tara:strand:+ start:46 stop:2088 length:2043 start_codon:yes stop_codon:yes gene_type:complete
MQVVLDVENTVTKRGGKIHFDPYETTNSLVMVGVRISGESPEIFTYNHNDSPCEVDTPARLQDILDSCTLLIGHNLVHDLTWLWEVGLTYNGLIWDTMVVEYVLQKSLKNPISLAACAERRNLSTKKQDTLKQYLSQGFSVADIPHEELVSYLKDDLLVTELLLGEQEEDLKLETNESLLSTIELSNKVTSSLARMNQSGFSVDRNILESIKKDYIEERKVLVEALDILTEDLMGDYPINLNSPEQLSWVIYSRRPAHKKSWPDLFLGRMKPKEFRSTISLNSDLIFKKKAKQCGVCYGKGKSYKTKKNGNPFARPTKCQGCEGEGYLYIPTGELAGLKFNAPNSKWITANGFSTSKEDLTVLAGTASSLRHTKAVDFLNKVKRLSAVETYLSSFIEGINCFTKQDNKLHVQLTQTVTATGRFSGRNPNMQNMPRGGTFPVKRCFVSRWEGGKILEADFAQLEFRVAAFLSQDRVAIDEVKNGFDVHSYTAEVITKAGQPTSRQEAKAHTFAPLYGATGFGRTPSEASYYEHFIQKYKGIAAWHSELAKEALREGLITTPSGRQFAFPYIERRPNGKPTHFTQIKNYPVQSFATADIVPLALTYIESRLEFLHTCIVNTVHDSIVLDVHPEEVGDALAVIDNTNANLKGLIDERWDLDFNVPLLLEAKMGPNWLDIKDVN